MTTTLMLSLRRYKKTIKFPEMNNHLFNIYTWEFDLRGRHLEYVLIFDTICSYVHI